MIFGEIIAAKEILAKELAPNKKYIIEGVELSK